MVVVALLSRFRDVLVTVVVSVPGSLILEVLLVIVRLIILPGGRLRLSHRWGVLSKPFVNQHFFLHGVDVHVCNWGLLSNSLNSASRSAPVGFNSLHVPLVHHCHNVLMLKWVQLSEDPFVPLVDQNFLLKGSNFVEKAHHEIDPAPINWFSKGLASSNMQCIHEIVVLTAPAVRDCEWSPETSPKEGMRVEVGFLAETFNGDGIKFNSSVVFRNIVSAGVSAGKVGLEARSKGIEVIR